MSAANRTIIFVISGWTYVVSFPYGNHDSEQLICSGRTRLAADDEDEIERRNLYLEVNRKASEDMRSSYAIREDGVNVTIYVDRNDFYRIFQELKDHYQIPECLMNIEIEGSIEEGSLFHFVDFQLNLSVDRRLHEQ